MSEPASLAPIGHNAPKLSLHIPEPIARPGDALDFSPMVIPEAVPRAEAADRRHGQTIRELAYGLIRVLDDDGRRGRARGIRGSTPDTLRRGLQRMMLTRAFDDRMYRAQRQGKTSFYMKSTGEEAVAVRPGAGAGPRRHVLSDLPPAGPADRARLSAGRR